MFFFFFFFKKIQVSVSGLLTYFFDFFLLKDFDIFSVLLLEVFLCIFNNVYSLFLCIQQKFYKKYFLSFFIKILFISIFFINIFFIRISLISIFFVSIFIGITFFIKIFSIRIRRNFSIVNNILRSSLTMYLHSSKNT